jgi:HD-like signal output (HDOD) protein
MTTESCEGFVVDAITAIDSIAGACELDERDWIRGAARGAMRDAGVWTSSQVATAKIARTLADLPKTLAVPPGALDAFDLSNLSATDSCQIAEAVARNGSFQADLLLLAGSECFSSPARPVVDLEEAVDRIGARRVGDLALATGVLGALAADAGPAMNVDLARRRCVAAGAAAELLISENANKEVGEGLFLNAMLHPLCRMTLAALYPQPHREMTRRCEELHETLEEQEARLFPLSHGEVIRRAVRAWGIPSVACEPLMHLRDGDASLAAVPEPLRTRVELLKLAVAIGQLAVGEWEPWDRVESPPELVLKRSGCSTLAAMVGWTKNRLEEMAALSLQSLVLKRRPPCPNAAARLSGELAYCCLSPQPSDYLAEIVSSTGIRLIPRRLEDLDAHDGVLFNCLWAFPHRLAKRYGGESAGNTRLIVTDVTHVRPCARYGRVLALPTSYGSLCRACRDVSASSGTADPC